MLRHERYGILVGNDYRPHVGEIQVTERPAVCKTAHQRSSVCCEVSFEVTVSSPKKPAPPKSRSDR